NYGTWVVQWNLKAAWFQTQFNWVDSPAMYHGAVGTFGFADGHAEAHKWLDPVIIAYGDEIAKGTIKPSSGYLDSHGALQKGPDYEYIRQGYRFPGWK
ncbi:MAG: hypothetical protein ACREFE_16115, partial [Limisphaerales bacterium]